MLNSGSRAMFVGLKANWAMVLFAVTLTSCDNWIVLVYSVENRSEDEVKIIVPYYRSTYCADSLRIIEHKIDSTVIIKPNETVVLNGVRMLYPSRRGYYRGHPGVHGIRRAYSDSLVEMGSTKNEWKYRKGSSVLIIE